MKCPSIAFQILWTATGPAGLPGVDAAAPAASTLPRQGLGVVQSPKTRGPGSFVVRVRKRKKRDSVQRYPALLVRKYQNDTQIGTNWDFFLDRGQLERVDSVVKLLPILWGRRHLHPDAGLSGSKWWRETELCPSSISGNREQNLPWSGLSQRWECHNLTEQYTQFSALKFVDRRF